LAWLVYSGSGVLAFIGIEEDVAATGGHAGINGEVVLLTTVVL